jgi:hypothetical protein
MNLLTRLGLTPEAIRRHVVRVEPPLTMTEIDRVLQQSTEAQRKRRNEFLAQGLSTLGTPRKRKANTSKS